MFIIKLLLKMYEWSCNFCNFVASNQSRMKVVQGFFVCLFFTSFLLHYFSNCKVLLN